VQGGKTKFHFTHPKLFFSSVPDALTVPKQMDELTEGGGSNEEPKNIPVVSTAQGKKM
jgi:hypothetical protein